MSLFLAMGNGGPTLAHWGTRISPHRSIESSALVEWSRRGGPCQAFSYVSETQSRAGKAKKNINTIRNVSAFAFHTKLIQAH